MNYFPAPNQRAYDLKLNVETTPPEDEFIDLRCVWAAECYPHDYLDKLFDDIQKLGWYQRGFFRSEEEAASWIKRSRQRPSVFGCLYIDTIYPCDGDIPVAEQPSALRAQLPSGVQYATAKIYSLTPSLVCVVMGFVFEKDFSARFQKALKTDRETYCKEPSSESGTQKKSATPKCRNLSIFLGFAGIWWKCSRNGFGRICLECFRRTLKAEPYLPASSSLSAARNPFPKARHLPRSTCSYWTWWTPVS